jgi:multidrug efflux pump
VVSQVLTLYTTPVVYLFFDRIGRKYLGTKQADEEFRRHEQETPVHAAGD